MVSAGGVHTFAHSVGLGVLDGDRSRFDAFLHEKRLKGVASKFATGVKDDTKGARIARKPVVGE